MPLDPAVQLQPHQERLYQAAQTAAQADKPFRVLTYWKPGSGKGLGSVATAEAFGRPYAAMMPAALRDTYRKERERFGGLEPPPLNLLSYSQVGRGALKDGVPDLVHADEVHRAAGTGSEAVAARAALHRARNVLLMTGTPVRNNPGEFGPLYGVLTGTPTTADQFSDRFVGMQRVYPGGIWGRLTGEKPTEKLTIKNRGELVKDLTGKVDYFSPDAPTVPVDEKVIEAEMSPNQADIYKGMWGQLPAVLRWKLRYDTGLTADELRKARSFLTGPRQVSLSDMPYRQDHDPLRAFHGSSKLRKAFSSVKSLLDSDPRTKAVAYANFIDAGLKPYAAGLAHAGIPHGFFHGGMSAAERKKMVDDFNAGRIRVALVGPAGSEGISLKGAQLFQLLDEHFHPVRSDQAMARVLRFDSHKHLPPELQRVTVERYRSRVPPGPVGRMLRWLGLGVSSEPGVDHQLAALSSRKGRAVEPLLDLLREVGTRKAGGMPFEDEIELWGYEKQATDAIPGGLADDVPRGEFDPKALLEGLKVEAEHTSSPAVAEEIARDHLVEDPKYYKKLKRMEAKGSAAGTPLTPPADLFAQAKALSDQGHFSAKTYMLREIIRKDPASWRVDSHDGYTVGLTHRSGWRYHLPVHQVSDLLPRISGWPRQSP